MCTHRNAAAASQEIIKAGRDGMDVGSKKGAFLRLMAMAAAVCGMSVSDWRSARARRQSPEAAAALWTVTGCRKITWT